MAICTGASLSFYFGLVVDFCSHVLRTCLSSSIFHFPQFANFQNPKGGFGFSVLVLGACWWFLVPGGTFPVGFLIFATAVKRGEPTLAPIVFIALLCALLISGSTCTPLFKCCCVFRLCLLWRFGINKPSAGLLIFPGLASLLLCLLGIFEAFGAVCVLAVCVGLFCLATGTIRYWGAPFLLCCWFPLVLACALGWRVMLRLLVPVTSRYQPSNTTGAVLCCCDYLVLVNSGTWIDRDPFD